jgi:hypothetical protein
MFYKQIKFVSNKSEVEYFRTKPLGQKIIWEHSGMPTQTIVVFIIYLSRLIETNVFSLDYLRRNW